MLLCWGFLGYSGWTIYGGAGNDILMDNGSSIYPMRPDLDNAQLYGGNGNDSLFGWFGDDHLDGGAGNDTLYGGGNDDTLYGGSGDDTLYGGSGDWVSTFFRGQTHVISYDDAYDNDHNDYGDDTIDGGAGNDTIDGGNGENTLTGGAGNDIFNYDHNKTSNDTITDFRVGEDTIDIIDVLMSDGNIHISTIMAIKLVSGQIVEVANDNGTDTTINIDTNLDGVYNEHDVTITLQNVSGYDLQGMLDNNIIDYSLF